MYNEKAIALFQNWEEALIWSCLQGYMGTLITDDEMTPESAIVIMVISVFVLEFQMKIY